MNVKLVVTIMIMAAFGCSTATIGADLDLARLEAAIASERINIEARPTFIPASLLDQLQLLSSQELDLLSQQTKADVELLRWAVRDAGSLEGYYKRLEEKGLLLDNGCIGVGGSGHEAELLAEGESPQLSFEHVLTKAYGVFLVRVTEARSGYYKGLGTRVVAEVEEVLGDSPLTVKPRDQMEYHKNHFKIEVGGEGYCAERRGFLEEVPGDQILLLAAPPTSYQGPGILVPSLMFPIRDGEILMQPYRNLLSKDPISVDRIRALLSSAVVPVPRSEAMLESQSSR